MKDDLAYLAALDAYKWWICSDFGFLKLTGILDAKGEIVRDSGKLDRSNLRIIAQAYTVSRNIPSHDADRQATEIADKLSNQDFHKILALPFATRAQKIHRWILDNPVHLASKNKDEAKIQRRIASAITKLTWFVRPTDWTIFDKFVGVAVLGKAQAGPAQMCDYYAQLEPSWNDTSKKLCKACEGNGFNPLMGYRIADKFLFLNGLGMVDKTPTNAGKFTEKVRARSLTERLAHPSVEAVRASLTSFSEALPVDLSNRLDALGKATAKPLRDANWISTP